MRYRVQSKYECAYPDPLEAHQGERLEFERRPGGWAGWIWCTSASGTSGWVPESWVRIEGSTCELFRDYDATELSVRAGEELVASRVESGWAWVTNSRGEAGWVPLDHLQSIEAEPTDP